MIRHLLFSAALVALFLWTSPTSATHKKKMLTEHRGDCRLGYHLLNVTTEDGCDGKILVLSCRGKCQSYSTPKFFTSQPQTGVAVFDHVSSCCTATKRTLDNVTVDVTCRDGTTKSILHFASTSTECACTELY